MQIDWLARLEVLYKHQYINLFSVFFMRFVKRLFFNQSSFLEVQISSLVPKKTNLQENLVLFSDSFI